MKRKVKEMPGVIIVTGGAEGIGAEICQGLAADGLKVVVADYAKDAAEKTAADIRRQSEKPLQFKSTSGIERDDWGRNPYFRHSGARQGQALTNQQAGSGAVMIKQGQSIPDRVLYE